MNPVNFKDVDMSIPSDWVNIDGLSAIYKNVPPESLSYIIRNRRNKGLAGACKRVGKFIFINTKGFAHWLANS